MIIVVSNKRTSKYNVVLSKMEISNLIPNIKWVKDEDYLFNTANDRLSKSEIKKILKAYPIYDYFNTSDYFEIDVAICRNFTVEEYLEKKTVLPKKGVSPVMSGQIAPVDNCPTFLFGNDKYVWKSELGLFEIFTNNDKSFGFYNPLTSSLVFKKLNQYDKYIEEINFLKAKFEVYMKKEIEDRYVRVITVYDKSTKELKYRRLNEEFNYNSFAYLNLKPLENDDLFLKSYLITEKLANEYLDWSYINIDFDFSKNDYYFETLNSETFSYSLADLFKEI